MWILSVSFRRVGSSPAVRSSASALNELVLHRPLQSVKCHAEKPAQAPVQHTHRDIPDVLAWAGHTQLSPRCFPLRKEVGSPCLCCRCSLEKPKPGNAVAARWMCRERSSPRSQAGLSLYPRRRNYACASLWLTIRQECMKIKQITAYYKKHISLIGF